MFFVDDSIKKIAPFKHNPKRNMGYQFVNVNNIDTTVLTYNNNGPCSDEVCFLYVTLYQTNHNRKEESYKYHNTCLALLIWIKKNKTYLGNSLKTKKQLKIYHLSLS